MRVIALRTLRQFWESNPAYIDAEQSTLAWFRHVLKADWAQPGELKKDFGNASILRDGRAVFNIAGNKYRIVVWINYPYRVVYVRFIGTHKQYDGIDAQTI
jgi:mRNA interferase HigB